MYTDGIRDLMAMIMMGVFKPPEEKEENHALIVTKAKTLYFPVFEKVGCQGSNPSGAQQCGRRPGAPATAAYSDPVGRGTGRGGRQGRS